MSKDTAFTKSREQWHKQAETALQEIESLQRKLPAEGIWTDAKDQETWKRCNADYDAARDAIAEHDNSAAVRKRLDELNEARARSGERKPGDPFDPNADRRQNAGGPTVEESRAIFGAWAKRQLHTDLTREERELCKRYRFNPAQRSFRVKGYDSKTVREMQRRYASVHPSQRDRIDLSDIEQRAMTVSATSGGEMIGRGIMPEFERAMLDYSGVLQVGNVFRTNTGEPLDWPEVNDTGNKGQLLAINTQDASNVDPTTGETTFNAYKFSSKIVLVPTELIEDDSAGFIAELPSLLGERVGRILEQYCTTGTGSSQPNGIVTASTLGKTAASGTAITADEIIQLEHSVDPAYRVGPKVGFMGHDAVTLAIRLLKDGENRYLWVAGLREGRSDMLLGYPFYRNQEMDSTLDVSSKVLLFGDFSKYRIRIVRDFRFYRMQERYRDYDQDGFVVFLRADANLVNAGTNPVKHLITAAS